MAALEEEGLITQPHTSAGRIPTDKGYRLFVDRLTTIKPMSAAEKRAIATILDGAVDLDDVVQRSVRLLAQLTHQVALVQYPTLSRSTVRHVELVAAPRHAPPGRADPQLPAGWSSGWSSCPCRSPTTTLAALRGRGRRRGHRLGHRRCVAGAARRSRTRREPTGPSRNASSRPSSRRCPTTAPSERVAVGGAANLARFGDSFEVSVRPLLEALEEHVVLLKLLGEAHTGGMVTVRIGHEGPYQEFASTSVVATGYGPGRRGARQPRRRRPHPHGLPGDDGGGARGRPLRLPHPRRGLGR